MQIKLDNRTDFAPPIERFESIAAQLSDREIELLICTNETMRELNREYRSKDRPTDVLSFPLEGEFDGLPLGSIVLSSDKIREKAEAWGHTPQEESILLFIHGLLHLLGYDHEKDTGEMRALEAELIRSMDLPESLIVRTTEEEEN